MEAGMRMGEPGMEAGTRMGEPENKANRGWDKDG